MNIKRDVFSGQTEKDSINATNKKKRQSVDSVEQTEQTEQPEQPIREPEIQQSVSVGNDTIEGADEKITVTPDELKGYIQAGIQHEMVNFNRSITQLKDELSTKQSEIDALADNKQKAEEKLTQELEKEKSKQNLVSKVLSDFGFNPLGQVSAQDNVFISPSSNRGFSISPRDAMREWNRILEDRDCTQATRVVNPKTGEQFIQMDTRPLRRFMEKYPEQLYDAMEALAKKEGLLKGRVSAYSGKDAPTSFNTIAPALKTYLSEFVRKEHDAQFVLWQIPNRTITIGVPPGQTTGVPRVRNLVTGSSFSDWVLDPTVAIDSGSQSLNASEEPVLIRELGMGKVGTAIKPLYIPEFVMANSLLDLQSILQQKIGYNYQEATDMSVLEILLSTTAVRYNNGGGVTDTVGDLGVGSSGQLSVAFLGNLYADMASNKIPTLPDGCYLIFVPPFALGQLNSDMQLKHQFFSQSNIEELTNMLFKKTSNEDLMTGNVRGYVGKISNFHIFSGNSFSVGASGTAGVQTETINAISTVTRSSFALGADAIAWATSMPMQIRQDTSDDFGRMQKFIWKSHESGAVALDVDPAINSPTTDDQQLRVFDVRLADTAV